MEHPPDDREQWQFPAPQPNTSYPPQQPNQTGGLPSPPNQPYQSYPQQPIYPPPPMQQPPKKPSFWSRKIVGIPMWLCALIIFIAIVVANGVFANRTTSNNSTPVVVQSTPTTAAADTPIPTDTPQPTDTSQPTARPQPTQSPAQIEKAYKSTTTSTTVADLDKNGNQWQYKNVHFTCTIVGFVKDDSGNTAGANVDDPNTSGVVQIVFPDNTDLSHLNTGDILEVWGLDAGVFSGQNAFGGTVHEVGITVLYMTDTTTNYQTS